MLAAGMLSRTEPMTFGHVMGDGVQPLAWSMLDVLGERRITADRLMVIANDHAGRRPPDQWCVVLPAQG